MVADLAHLVDLHDVGMHQRGCRLSLALEPPYVRFVGCQTALEHLDRHLALERKLLAQVDLGHRPLA